ncbi:MAG: lipocalin-like domain-containing protein [Muribaculaceae bacterium]|nr:lipocalin-like domain-containing protein [Muribaculaceae bacterium]
MNVKLHNMKVHSLQMLILGVLLMCGCTQQNGYIGDLFGSWSLTKITCNGDIVEIEYETVFSFQNEIVSIVGYVDPPFEAKTRYGNFTHLDQNLTLKFASEPTPTYGKGYMAPEWLYFPKDENILLFEVRKLTGRSMELSLASDGSILHYSFRKTW